MWHEDRLLIDGDLGPAEAGRTYETVNPTTGGVLGTAADATVGDAHRAIDAARRAFDTTSWATDRDLRTRCLRQLHEALVANSDDLRTLLIAENGLPHMLTQGPGLDTPVSMINYYAELLEKYEWTEDLGVSEAMGRRSIRWVEKEPVGVVGAIVPYNYPVQISLAKLIPALAAGRRIMADASATVKKVFLELGGKSAFVVMDDAPLDIAAMFAAFTIVSHAGQGCAITTRLLVPQDKHDELVEQTAEMMAGVAVGDPSDPANMMGPLISEMQRQKVDSCVKAAVAEGGTVVTGGKVPDGLPDGYFYEPTLVTGLGPDATLAQEEVFGPVLAVLPYRDDDDAVAIANNSIFGLSGTVFGIDEERATAVARRLRTGTVSVNGGMWYGADAPFGGYKQSGIGREMGVPGLEEYIERKTLAKPAE